MKISLVGSAIGALVLVNAVTFVAVEKHFEVTPEASSTPIISDSSAPSSAGSATSNPAPAPAVSTAENVIPSPDVFVVATNATDGWRAVNSGGCDGSVTVQATTDGGRTWSDKAKAPVGAADGISIDGQGRLQLSGQASDGCAHKVWAVEGSSWSTTDSASWVTGGTHSADVLHAGDRRKACDAGSVIDIATTGDSANVLCSNGAVRAVPANGAAHTIYQSAGALSIGTTGDNGLVVARSEKKCDGVELATVSKGSAKPITCVQGANKAVDLTFAGDQGWLVAAHNTWTGKSTGDWSKS